MSKKLAEAAEAFLNALSHGRRAAEQQGGTVHVLRDCVNGTVVGVYRTQEQATAALEKAMEDDWAQARWHGAYQVLPFELDAAPLQHNDWSDDPTRG